ncbi:MAG: DUF3373 domain-containing protein [Deferribacterales bacterium]
MKKIVSLILLVLFPASFAFAADVTLEELKSQISSLQDEVLKMSRRVDKNEVHRIKDKVDIGVELRSRVDSISYDDMLGLPAMANDMMGLWLRDYLVNDSGPVNDWDVDGDGFNDAFMATYGADMQALLMPMAQQMVAADPTMDINTAMNALFGEMYQIFDSNTVTSSQAAMMKGLFNSMKPRKYDHNNSSIFTNKFRIRLNSSVNENLSFTGRLAMYKVWGDATDVRWNNGQFNSMYLDGNAAAVPTDDKIHVERAYFVYKNELGPVDWHLSLGRRPSAYGPGKESSEYSGLGGSPLASIIQWNFDGASLQFNFENVFEFLPGSFFKICYGRGYESDWGSSNAYASNNGLIATPDVDDVDLLGFIVKFYDDDQYKFWYNYSRGFGMTDGFTGAVVMPYAITGMDYNLDGQYDEYQFDMNSFGSASRVEATSKVGDMEWHSFMAQGETFGFNWFASYSLSKSHPDGQSASAMYQFMDMDRMLGSRDSETGHSVWVGVMTPELPFTGGKLGFEYNQGSKYWVGMTGAEDDLVGSKIAVRGKVYDLYYHQPIVSDRLFMTVGYQHFDYEYTGSGSYLGAPVKIEDATAMNTMTAVADKVDKFYASMTYRY